MTRSVCERQVTCGECTNTAGCAFCKATARCMPSANLHALGPDVGWCPSTSWATQYQQCGDSCHEGLFCTIDGVRQWQVRPETERVSLIASVALGKAWSSALAVCLA